MSDPIVTSIVKLSERYITDRFLPDKAIDLLDESCACCNLRHPEITELMETQRTVADLETREHELENPEPQNGQDAAIDYEALAAVKTDLAKQREKLPALQLKVAEIEVTMDDVAQVIELWTGVPAVKIKETEYGRCRGWRMPSRRTSSARTRLSTPWPGPSSAPARPVWPSPPGQLYLRRPHRRRQDRAGQAAGQPAVRHR